ncbi:MAG: histidinol dehydrogenase, partial [Neisseriaceae bacterium]|nr:histidinol dehydrogenase [Neisseriaceae bacterium]
MKTLNWSTASILEQNAALNRPETKNKINQIQSVADILAHIQTKGDAALLEYVQRFDGNHPSSAANLPSYL